MNSILGRVVLTLGPCNPGVPGGQTQGAGVEPTSLGPFRHYKDKKGNEKKHGRHIYIHTLDT